MNAVSHDCSADALQPTEVGVAADANREAEHRHESRDPNRSDDPLTELTTQLSDLDLRAAALLLTHNIAGGVAATQKSYRLMQAYTLDDAVRARIDSIVDEHPRRAEGSCDDA